eukprot:7068350-Pyramimonas_sp.AAC.1
MWERDRWLLLVRLPGGRRRRQCWSATVDSRHRTCFFVPACWSVTDVPRHRTFILRLLDAPSTPTAVASDTGVAMRR